MEPMMNQGDAQRFLDTINTFDFFSGGEMDVEDHCVGLAQCFVLDGVSPRPSSREIYDMLASLVDEAAVRGEMPPLKYTRFASGVDFNENVHPGGQLTLLLPASAWGVCNDYLFGLGQLVGRFPSAPVPQLGYWIDPSWTFVAAFVVRFHRCVMDLAVQVDQEGRQQRGYSDLEALRLAVLQPDCDAEGILSQRVDHLRTMLEEMAGFLRLGAYAEAVSIQETLITRLIGDALELHGRKIPGRLMDFIDAARSLHAGLGAAIGGHDIWGRLDQWRRDRNAVVHAPRASLFDPIEPLDVARARVRQTAEEGARLVADIEVWSIEARARSLDMSLPRPTRTEPPH